MWFHLFQCTDNFSICFKKPMRLFEGRESTPARGQAEYCLISHGKACFGHTLDMPVLCTTWKQEQTPAPKCHKPARYQLLQNWSKPKHMPNKAEHTLEKNTVFCHFFINVLVIKSGLTLKEIAQGGLGIRWMIIQNYTQESSWRGWPHPSTYGQ